MLHLLAIAFEAGVELELDDFNRVGARVPHIADMKPHGKYHMIDLDRIGGVPVVMQELLDAGPAPRRLPHGHGQDRGREPRRPRPARARRRRRAPARRTPIHAQGGIAVLRGSLAPNGAVVKVAGHRRACASRARRASSTARTLAMEAILAGSHPARRRRRDPLRGPEGRPGMREMLAVTGAMKGAGRGADAALVTDGRFSGGTHGFCVGLSEFSEGLQALLQRPSGLDRWDGPYLRADREVPRDPWQNAYVYRSPGEKGVFDLFLIWSGWGLGRGWTECRCVLMRT